jgi:hypothetical protein
LYDDVAPPLHLAADGNIGGDAMGETSDSHSDGGDGEEGEEEEEDDGDAPADGKVRVVCVCVGTVFFFPFV